MIHKLRKIISSSTSRDTLISFVGLGTISVVGMLFTVLTARAFGPEGLGLFAALNALVTLLAGVGDMGLSSALVNFLPKFRDDRKTLISVTFWFQIASAFFLTLLLILTSLFHRQIIPGSNISQFFLIALLTGTYVLQGFALGVFNADKKFLHGSILQGSDSILKLIFVAVLIYTSHLSIELALLANIISCSVSLLFGFRTEFNNIRLIFPRHQLKTILSFSKWIALSRVFGVMVSRIDVLLLNLLSGAYATGLFAAASRISLFFALLVSSIGSVTAPRFSSFSNKTEIRSYFYKVLYLVGGISLLMLSSTILAGPLVLFVFGNEFLPAVPVFRAITIAMIPFLLSVAITNPLVYSFNQPHFLARITIIQVISIVILDVLLIPRFSAMAPAISLGITNTLILILSGIKLHKLLS